MNQDRTESIFLGKNIELRAFRIVEGSVNLYCDDGSAFNITSVFQNINFLQLYLERIGITKLRRVVLDCLSPTVC